MSESESPILSFFETVFSPIIWFMDSILGLYISVIPSPGLCVVLLAITMTLICWPLQKYGRGIEESLRLKIAIIDKEIEPFKATLKGEKLFIETERIYKNHKYHPIKSVGLGMSFAIILPVLISAIILLSNHSLLEGQSFLFIPDLSEGDSLLGSVHFLPILMSSITIFDAFHRFRDDTKMRTRFVIIAIVLFGLVYSLPSALIIYWTTNIMISMCLALAKKS